MGSAKPAGDGHAILSAAPFIEGHDPVAVLFGDDIVMGKKPALKELIEVYNRYEDPVIALKQVPREEVSRFGVIGGKKINKSVWEIREFIEKPAVKEAPSNLVVVGRYILTPEIFKILNTV
ncbi:MAG: UTP-glucose-1-phosphate uridylyltransferase, partial [Parcubacteria group bacterium GW2011_GWC2_45_7]